MSKHTQPAKTSGTPVAASQPSPDWKKLEVALDETHHLKEGQPAYLERFEQVLKFHPPGLAPVLKDGKAWHIHPDGSSAYAERFQRTFGFYEGLASVILIQADESAPQACHIHPDGTIAYAERYAWCGNFQEGRAPVRDHQGFYHHILPDGRRLSPTPWRYAGDFKDGVAVVQDDSGRSLHITRDGERRHERTFLDLDVFHKGFARALDEEDWHHIRQDGRPAYSRRFKMVEPFYNGQARVECANGALEIIDEAGNTLHTLREGRSSELASLSADLVGFWKTWTIGHAVELGVIEALPGSAEQVANKTSLNEKNTWRLLQGLQELGLVLPDPQHRWSLTPRGQLLRSDHPQTLADAAIEYFRHFPRLWDGLDQAIKQPEGWIPPPIFEEVAADPERLKAHHRMLRSYARHDYTPLVPLLKLEGVQTLVDAGGGVGVISQLLLEHWPELEVTLMDLPTVVAHARTELQPLVERHPGRLTFQPGDLFEPWDVQAERVILARVLHDWSDDKALEILKQARAALQPGGKLILLELLLDPYAADGALLDLHLLAATGGCERTEQDFTRLLSQAGFTLEPPRRTHALPSILTAVLREEAP